ncbi:hypothetical protein JCM3775_000838 [Rhodotorula graminis]
MQPDSDAPVPPLRVAIVGGGIAGLVTALALQQRLALASASGAHLPLTLTLLEQSARFAEIGAGVSLGPNAQRVLRVIGLGPELDAVAGETAGALSDGELWFQFRVGQRAEDEGKVFAHVRGENGGRGNVHRADLLEQLANKLPPDIARFHHRVVSYRHTPTGVELAFSDPSLAPLEVDVVLASDGIKSPVRARLYERLGLDAELHEARYAEWVAWRGLIPRAEYDKVFEEDAEAPTNRMHVGLGRHILTFPVRGGTLVNLVGFVRDEQHAKLGGHTGPWSEPRPKEEMLDDFAGFSEQLKKLLRAIDNPSIWGIFSIPQLSRVSDDRVLLIGDAAHATTPHCGAGAGQAIEDAHIIAALLSHPSILSSTGSSRTLAINRALAVYERERQPRAARVQEWSRQAGLLYEFLGPDGDDLERMRVALEGRMGWIWEYDPEREASRLERLLGAEL